MERRKACKPEFERPAVTAAGTPIDLAPEDAQAVWDQLDSQPVDEDRKFLIARALLRLPPRVRSFAVDRCRFISVGKTSNAVALPGRLGIHPVEQRSRNMWLVVLSEYLEGGEGEGIVAHEVAHAWLGHDPAICLDGDEEAENEIAASKLAAEWGFSGIGASPSHNDLRTSQFDAEAD